MEIGEFLRACKVIRRQQQTKQVSLSHTHKTHQKLDYTHIKSKGVARGYFDKYTQVIDLEDFEYNSSTQKQCKFL